MRAGRGARGIGAAAAVVAVFAPAGLASSARAQVVLDGTVGPGVARALEGRDVEIRAADGERRGGNLFHSFERFSVPSGGSATFTGPGGIANVVSRVTGGEVSAIDGTLRSAVPGADLWFLNPAGVAFGPDARLDVPGSFHVSTADELRFEDGAVFSARDPAAGRLTVAAPEAFGFLGADPGRISVDGATLEVPAGERLALVGGAIGIGGGDGAGAVRAEAGRIELAARASAGEVPLAAGARTAPAADGDVTLDGGAVLDVSGDGGGTVRIRAGRLVADGGSTVAAINTGARSGGGGGIEIEAARAELDGGSVLSASAAGSGRGGRVRASVGELEVRGGARIQSATVGDGDAGGVTLRVGRLLIEGGVIDGSTGAVDPQTGAVSGGVGRGGGVRIVAGEAVEIAPGATGLPTGVTSNTTAGGPGAPVEIRAPELTLAGGQIASSTFGDGDAGGIAIVADRLSLTDGGAIVSESGGFATGSGAVVVGGGAGGDVRVTAREALRIVGGRGGVVSGISSTTAGDGDAGDVMVRSGRIEILDGGRITANSGGINVAAGELIGGSGAAGDVSLEAADSVLIAAASPELGARTGVSSNAFAEGPGGRVRIATGTLRLDGGRVQTATIGDGDAGGIAVEADRLSLVNGGSISTESGTLADVPGGVLVGMGRAGGIRIEVADSLEILGGPGILSGITSTTGGDGDAGGIAIAAGRVRLVRGGQITAGTGGINPLTGRVFGGSGDAGDVSVRASESLSLVGTPGEQTSTGVFSNAFVAGDGGRIAIEAPVLTLRSAQIQSSTIGDGDAGGIGIGVDRLSMADGAGIFSESGSFEARLGGFVVGGGSAGDVRITAARSVDVLAGRTGLPSLISSSTGGDGDAGDVEIVTGGARLLGGGQVAAVAGAADPVTGELLDTSATGDAGGVTLRASGNVLVAGAGPQAVSGASTFTRSAGDAGAIRIEARRLRVETAGEINSSSLAAGKPGAIRLDVDRLELIDGAAVGSASFAPISPPGDTAGGTVSVVAASEVLVSGRADANSGIATSTVGARDAGNIRVAAPVLRLERFGLIDSSTVTDAAAGRIVVDVGRLEMGPSAFINSSSFAGSLGFPRSVGRGGRIEITAAESIEIDGTSSEEPSAIATATTNAGAAGSIEIATPRLSIERGAITTSSEGTGNAGDIRITATDRLAMRDARISSEAEAAGGGRVTIRTDALIDLRDSQVTTSVAGERGSNAGNIDVDPPRFLVLDGSSILARANAGAGGSIALRFGTLFRSADSEIDASAGPAGIDGTVRLNGPEENVSSGVTVLPATFLDASALLRESCAARRTADVSSFTAAGRGGLPAGPDAPLPGFYALRPEEPPAAGPMAGAAEAPHRLASLDPSCGILR